MLLLGGLLIIYTADSMSFFLSQKHNLCSKRHVSKILLTMTAWIAESSLTCGVMGKYPIDLHEHLCDI